MDDPQVVLERHERAVNGLRVALVDLEASPSYLILASADVGPVTKAKIEAAVVGLGEHWARLHAADAALAQIREYIDREGVRGRHRARVMVLLEERWPVASASLADPALPPGRSVGPDRLTITQLLDAVRQTYDGIRPFVAAVDELWLATLPRIDAAKATLIRLTAEVEALGVPEPLIGRAESLLADLEKRLVGDPLDVTVADGDKLNTAVREATRRVSATRAGHDELDDDLARTEQVLAALRVLRAEAEAAGRQSRAKVANAEGLVAVPTAGVFDAATGLGSQLDTLFDIGDDAAWRKRRNLLDAWLATAARLEAQLTRAKRANTEPLRLREELRGRLGAYRAKIAAVGRAEDPELTELTDEARTELYTAPADLDRAGATIDELAERLRS